jgi:hypothetical protein
VRRLLALAALLIAAISLAGCGGDTYAWNQKLAVTVDTPDGPRSGAAVTQVTASVGKQGYLSAAIVGYSVKGEATVVDLGDGRYLFALLSRENNPTEYWMEHTFGDRVTLTNQDGGVEALKEKYGALTKLRGAERMSPSRYPLLVTFSDLNNPKSVREVKPDRFADALGSGYSLTSITLEITDDGGEGGEISILENLGRAAHFFRAEGV